MNIRPLGDRVLIKPLANPTETDSGIIIAEDKKPDEVGTVVAVGYARHPRAEEAEQVAASVETVFCDGCDDDDLIARDAAVLLRELVLREPCVKVGDTVLFSWASGQELTLDEGKERYLLMRECDLIAVLDDPEVTVG